MLKIYEHHLFIVSECYANYLFFIASLNLINLQNTCPLQSIVLNAVFKTRHVSSNSKIIMLVCQICSSLFFHIFFYEIYNLLIVLLLVDNLTAKYNVVLSRTHHSLPITPKVVCFLFTNPIHLNCWNSQLLYYILIIVLQRNLTATHFSSCNTQQPMTTPYFNNTFVLKYIFQVRICMQSFKKLQLAFPQLKSTLINSRNDVLLVFFIQDHRVFIIFNRGRVKLALHNFSKLRILFHHFQLIIIIFLFFAQFQYLQLQFNFKYMLEKHKDDVLVSKHLN